MSEQGAEKVKVLIIRHNEEPEAALIDNNFRAMQKIVKGRFTYMPFDESNPDCEIMVNDEYLMNGSKFNRYIQSDFHTVENGGATEFGVPIMGTFAVVRHDMTDGETVSLTDEDVKKYSRVFRL